MKNLLKFSDKALSKAEMSAVTGGQRWCYAYDCTCGSTSYNSWGNLQDYQHDATQYCTGQGPVNCTFSSLPSGSCDA